MNIPLNLVIFASREQTNEMQRTLSTALLAVPAGSIVDVVINGNRELAEWAYLWVSIEVTDKTKTFRIWSITVGDKGNAWNQHIHAIWPPGLDAVYLDGYVQVSSAALQSLVSTLNSNPFALGTSGVPSIGVSAKLLQKKMLAIGGFHGNLCAIKAEAMLAMRDRGIRIPLGMYRVDSIMGAFLAFGLDNTRKQWDPFLYLPLTPDASWRCEEKKWYRLKDMIAWRNRRRRQAQGDIENAAVKYFLTVLRIDLERLPKDVGSLVKAWSDSAPEESRVVSKRGQMHVVAMRNILGYIPPSPFDCLAEHICPPSIGT